MASVTYNVAKTAIGNGSIDLDTDDLRIALVMTNTTVDTENATIDNVSAFDVWVWRLGALFGHFFL
jgi:hypothetical protein